jgi:pimeloyl-ACP methyl ester carboxylesterase
VIALPDGRRLCWHEFGDPGGSPVIYTAGTPVSGLGGAWYDQTARAAGLRWISPDKPGYGGSDYQPKRSLTSWSDDLAALAGHLGLDRFALAGESGGGPFTLAAAHRLADRVSVAALIAMGGPMDPAERAGQQARIRFYGWLARNAPTLNAVPLTVMRWSLASPARRERSLRREMAATPEAKHASLRIEFEAVADALRHGRLRVRGGAYSHSDGRSGCPAPPPRCRQPNATGRPTWTTSCTPANRRPRGQREAISPVAMRAHPSRPTRESRQWHT